MSAGLGGTAWPRRDATTPVPDRDYLIIEQFARERNVALATAYQWFGAGHASKKCPQFPPLHG